MSLDASTLAKLDGLKVRARAVVEGVLSGLHKSPHQGQSVEFAQHKEYAPGDELRHLDWKALARFDKYYIKRYEHETNLRAALVVDAHDPRALRYLIDTVGINTVMLGTCHFVLPRCTAGKPNCMRWLTCC